MTIWVLLFSAWVGLQYWGYTNVYADDLEKQLRSRYDGLTLLRGLLQPKSVRSEMSVDDYQKLMGYRQGAFRYIAYIFLLPLVAIWGIIWIVFS